MATQTYYLTTNLDKSIRSLSDLPNGWQLDTARVLLDFKLSDQDKMIKVRNLINQQQAPPEQDYKKTMDQLSDILPKNIRNKARMFLAHVLPRTNIDDSGVLVLPDGSKTAPLIDILRFFCSPSNLGIAPVEGLGKLADFLREINIPQAALGRGKLVSPVHWMSL